MTVYLIHLDQPYHHARHYLGSAKSVKARLDRHRRGQGSPLLRAATLAGITFAVVRTWKGGRNEEREKKRRHRSWELCPACRFERGLSTSLPDRKSKKGCLS